MDESKNLFLTKTVLVRTALVGVAVFHKPSYDFIKENMDAYFLFDLLITMSLRYVTKKPVRII